MARQVDPVHAHPLYRLLRAVLRPLVLGGLRPTVEGREHVPADGPAILCANHLSVIDPVIIPLLLRRPVTFLAKSEYFHQGPSRWLLTTLGEVPVAREGGAAATSTLDRGTAVLRAGGLLCLFPEGTRSPDGRLYRGKTGPVRLARRGGAPIVPVGLIGTREVIPPHSLRPRLGGPVIVRFGTPLDVGGARDAQVDLRAEADRLMRAIQSLTGQTYVDVYARRRHTSPSDDAFGQGPQQRGAPPSDHGGAS